MFYRLRDLVQEKPEEAIVFGVITERKGRDYILDDFSAVVRLRAPEGVKLREGDYVIAWGRFKEDRFFARAIKKISDPNIELYIRLCNLLRKRRVLKPVDLGDEK